MRTMRNVVIGFLFISIITGVNIVNQVNAQSIQELEVNEISQIDTHAWAANVVVQDNIAYVSDLEGLNIFDISDVENPIELSYFDEGVVEPHEIYVDGNYVYMADYTAGFKIIDVSDTENPTQVGVFHDGGEVGRFEIVDDIAFIADFVDGIEIVNISDISQLTEITQYDTDITNAYNIQVHNDLAYVSDFVSPTEKYLRILDISDFSNIEEVAEYSDISGEVFGITFVEDVAYMACSLAGVNIFDASNHLDLVELGSFSDGGHTVEIEFYEGYMVVADREDGLEIFDVSDPANLTKIAEYDDGGNTAGIEIVNDLIFIADGDDGLEILQIVITPTTTSGTLTPTIPDEPIPFEIFIIGGALGAIVLIVTLRIYYKRK